MSKIGKESKHEILIRKHLFAKGFRFRKNDKRLPGKPDIVLPKYHTVLFVHGCFWHGHTCKAGKLPETRVEFWTKKIGDNRIRDQQNIEVLQSDGWKVIVIWQCEIKSKSNQEIRLNRLIEQIYIGMTKKISLKRQL